MQHNCLGCEYWQVKIWQIILTADLKYVLRYKQVCITLGRIVLKRVKLHEHQMDIDTVD